VSNDRPYHDALLDWMACAIAGAAEPAARAAREAGDGLGDKVAAAAAAGHVLDFDDTYLPGVAHLSAPTAPVAVVLGARRGARVADVLDAYSAGFEAAGAMARASHPALYDGGWHPTAVCGALGAAVTASRLLDLSPAAEQSAAALALSQAGGMRPAFGSAGKSLQVGLAASAGVAAARMAAAGAELDLAQIAHAPAGFEAVFGAAFEQPGERLAIEENWIKAYPCCLQTHGAIEAALLARAQDDLGPPYGELGLEVTVHPLSLQAAPVTEPADGLQAKFSIPYVTALALLRGAPGTASFGRLDDEAIELARSVAVRANPALAESEAQLGVEGRQVAQIEAALGSPQRPMDPRQLADKRRGLAGERLEGALEDPERPASELFRVLGL
jgi:2-methylcitrate dehydratase PrpD